MQNITVDEAKKYGIQNKHSLMDNDEKRFRQICLKDNTSYIRTESGIKGYWQKSHYHKYAKEIYIIQKGKILFAQYKQNKIEIKELNEGEFINTEPNTPHNVYMYPNTVTHTVKYGINKESDWIPYEILDKELDELILKEK